MPDYAFLSLTNPRPQTARLGEKKWLSVPYMIAFLYAALKN